MQVHCSMAAAASGVSWPGDPDPSPMTMTFLAP